MIDVLMLAGMDNANTGWKTAQCLKLLGLDVMFLKGMYHDFMYPEQGCVHPAIQKALDPKAPYGPIRVGELKGVANNARIIHYISSSFIDVGVDSKRKIIMQHGGAWYRVHHEVINKNLNPYIHATAIQMPDLLGLGAKNEHLIYFSVDTDSIFPNYERSSEKLTIGHFPTGSTNKGTKEFLKVIEKLSADPDTVGKFEYIGITDKLDVVMWTDGLRRMAMCDVILDVLAPTAQGGRKYGEWGNVAFEAAALGVIPITNCNSVELYKKEYGCYPQMRIANSEAEVEKALRELIFSDDAKIFEEKKRCREWVEQNHSFEATAQRYWKKVYKEFF